MTVEYIKLMEVISVQQTQINLLKESVKSLNEIIDLHTKAFKVIGSMEFMEVKI